MIGALVLTAGINFLVDPFSIYGTGIFEPYRANSYVEKADMFEAFDPPAQAIIIGSSRVGSVDPLTVTELTGLRCYNWSVPSAGVDAASAIVHMAVEDFNAPVEMVIIGIDPDVFHQSFGLHAQAKLAPRYSGWFGEDVSSGGLMKTIGGLLRLITLEQLNASIAVLRREMGDTSIEQIKLYREDGFALYTPKEEAIAEGTYDLNAIIDGRISGYPNDNFCIQGDIELSETTKNKWIELLDYCVENGIAVYAYMPPGHPEYIEMLEGFGSMISLQRISEFLDASISEHGGTFRDFTMLESFGGDTGDFYDEVHMRKANNDRLLIDLLSNYEYDHVSGAE